MHKIMQKQNIETENGFYTIIAEYDEQHGYGTKIQKRTNSKRMQKVGYWTFGVGEESARVNWYWFTIVLSAIQRFRKLPDWIADKVCIAHKDKDKSDYTDLDAIQDMIKKYLVPYNDGHFRVLFDEDINGIENVTKQILEIVQESLGNINQEKVEEIQKSIQEVVKSIY